MRDIVGLGDEKSQIQALDRTRAVCARARWSGAPMITLRHGTTISLAALDARTGKVIGQSWSSASLDAIESDRLCGQLRHPQDGAGSLDDKERRGAPVVGGFLDKSWPVA